MGVDGARRVVRVGWALSAAVAVFLAWSAVTKFVMTDGVRAEMAHLGLTDRDAVGIGVAQAVGVVLYLLPRTGLVGAVLITGYMGGGTALHLRAGDPVALPVVTGAAAWLGLVLRDARVRAAALGQRQRGGA